MKLPIEFPDLKIPTDLRPEEMPDLLRYWYLGTRGRRHMMLRRFGEVDARIAPFEAGSPKSEHDYRVLDVGSAWGFNVMALERMGYRATGLDLVADQFEVGGRIARANDVAFTVVGADAAKLPFGDASFDVVTMVETFEHIYLEDRRAALDECNRVLRRGGRLIMSTPNYRSLVERFKRYTVRRRWLRSRLPTMCYPQEGINRQEYHPYRYHHPLPEEQIRNQLENAGFGVSSTTRFLFMLKNTPDWLYPAVAGIERMLESAPGLRRLAATACFTAEKR
jgi:ubiquinone/menaquinone biosynthesis C-methylase UbiE